MRFLVTGGAGFIGSHLTEALLDGGHAVRILDDLSTGRLANLDAFRDSIEFHEGTILDAEAVRSAAAGVDGIFHLAAVASVPRSVADPILTLRANVEGTTQVLLAAREAHVKRIVVASSSAVYGDDAALPASESAPTRPMSPYALQKLACEHLAAMAMPLYGVSMVAVRYFNVFGPRQDPKSDYAAVIPKFVTCMLDGRRPVVFGDGLQSRDFTYVENTVRGTILAMTTAKEVSGEVFNVACGDRFTLLELCATLREVLGRPNLMPELGPERPGDVKHSQAAVEKVKRELGFVPTVTFAEGLARTAAWYRQDFG